MSKRRTLGDLAWDGKKKVTRREQFLTEMDAVVPWQEFVRLVRPAAMNLAWVERGRHRMYFVA